MTEWKAIKNIEKVQPKGFEECERHGTLKADGVYNTIKSLID